MRMRKMTPFSLKKIVKFSDLELPIERLSIDSNRVRGIVPKGWHRVSFNIGDSYTGIAAVEEWLNKNCNNKWFSYNYNDLKNKNDLKMVVYFECLNDGLFFKLQDGHNAWKNKDNLDF